jgi:hypothetical protein
MKSKTNNPYSNFENETINSIIDSLESDFEVKKLIREWIQTNETYEILSKRKFKAKRGNLKILCIRKFLIIIGGYIRIQEISTGRITALFFMISLILGISLKHQER